MNFGDLPRSREEALLFGEPLFFTGRACRRGHIAPRETGSRWCLQCKALGADKRRERAAERKRERRATDPEFRARELEINRRWLDKPGNRETHYARNAAVHKLRLQNDPEYRETVRGYSRKHQTTEKGLVTRQRWREENRHREAEYASKRRAYLLAATPPWLTDDMRAEMQSHFQEAADLTEMGVAHEVDHIIPLINDAVCGLHVPWNMRVIPMTENRSKANRLPAPADWLAPTSANATCICEAWPEFANDNVTAILWFAIAV